MAKEKSEAYGVPLADTTIMPDAQLAELVRYRHITSGGKRVKQVAGIIPADTM